MQTESHLYKYLGNYPGSAISTTGPKISLIPLPPKAKSSLSNGRFKWLRGIEAKDGCIYAIPSNALQVLRIDPALNIQEKNGTDQVKTFGGPWQGTWKWHGGVLAADGVSLYDIALIHICAKLIHQSTQTA